LLENLEEEIDRLYALDPGAFTGARDELARELRKAGRREEAELLKQLRKPTLSAWTINQLARQERRAVDLLLDAGHRLRDVQQGLLAGAEVGGLDEARRTQQAALAELRGAAARILAEAGRGNDSTLNRIVETLQVAAVSSEGRELLARGRLTVDLEATGFDLLAPLAGSGHPAKTASREARHEPGRKLAVPRPRTARSGPRQAQQARERERNRQRLEEARRRLREAKATMKAATKKARAAEQDTATARRELERAEERMRGARAAALEAQKAAEQAARDVSEAERNRR
jgi:hypothetical protein